MEKRDWTKIFSKRASGPVKAKDDEPLKPPVQKKEVCKGCGLLYLKPCTSKAAAEKKPACKKFANNFTL